MVAFGSIINVGVWHLPISTFFITIKNLQVPSSQQLHLEEVFIWTT